MKQELNIAAILKDKPEDTSLWSPIFGNVLFTCVNNTERDSRISIVVRHNGYTEEGFFCDGRFDKDGECLLFPSKQMQDWSKFAWKKGDVLKGIKGITCIFDSFSGENYIDFRARYYYDPEDEDWEYNTTNLSTLCFKKADESDRASYIKKVEGHYGGKLNPETLETEKPESQFKDGDVVCFYGGRGCFDTIAIIEKQGKPTSKVYAHLEIPIMKLYYQDDNFFPYTRKLRLATDSEKQQLFNALAKEGKRWNSKTKAVEDLPKHKRAIWRYHKKCEFKPMDYMLVRDKNQVLPIWQLYQYAHENENYIYVVGSLYGLDRERMEVLPYNDQTAHLLGTTDDYEEGGEG